MFRSECSSVRRPPDCCWLHVPVVASLHWFHRHQTPSVGLRQRVVASLHWFPGHQTPSVGLRQPSSFVGRFRKARLGVCPASVQWCFASTETQGTVRDGDWEPWMATLTFSQLLSSELCHATCAWFTDTVPLLSSGLTTRSVIPTLLPTHLSGSATSGCGP